MAGNIFDQSFDELMASVNAQVTQAQPAQEEKPRLFGAEPVQPVQPTQPVQEKPQVFGAAPVQPVAPTQEEPVIQAAPEVKEDYRVDMNIFGPQTDNPQPVKPAVAPTPQPEPVKPDVAPVQEPAQPAPAEPATSVQEQVAEVVTQSVKVELDQASADAIQEQITALVTETVRKAVLDALAGLSNQLK